MTYNKYKFLVEFYDGDGVQHLRTWETSARNVRIAIKDFEIVWYRNANILKITRL